MEKAASWLQRHFSEGFDAREVVNKFTPWVDYLEQHLATLLSEPERQRFDAGVKELTEKKLPAQLATRIVALEYLYQALDIAAIAQFVMEKMPQVVPAYFAFNSDLGLFWLRRHLSDVPNYDPLHRKAKESLATAIDNAVCTQVSKRLAHADGETNAHISPEDQSTFGNLMAQLRANPNPNLAHIVVAIEHIETLR